MYYMMINLSHVTKMLLNIILIAMGTVVPMSKVEGSWNWLSGLCNNTYLMYHDDVIHTRMRITGRFKGYFPSVHMANLSATG